MLEVVAMSVAGVVLLAGVVLVVRSQHPAAHPECGACGYDLSGHGAWSRCPECGAALKVVGIAAGEPRQNADMCHLGIVLLVAGSVGLPVAWELAEAVEMGALRVLF